MNISQEAFINIANIFIGETILPKRPQPRWQIYRIEYNYQWKVWCLGRWVLLLTPTSRQRSHTACFDEVYIVSNLPLDRLYTFEKQSTPEVYDAFIQRIKTIIKFTGFLEWHYELKDGKPVPPPKLKVADLKPVDDGELPF